MQFPISPVWTDLREFVLTPVILAPGACGRGPHTAAPDTVSGGSGGSACEFQKASFGATLHNFLLIWGTQNDPKVWFWTTLHHLLPKSLILSNTLLLLATFGVGHQSFWELTPKSETSSWSPSFGKGFGGRWVYVWWKIVDVVWQTSGENGKK